MLPPGRRVTLRERWLTEHRVYSCEFEIEVGTHALTALSQEVKRATGKRPVWLKDQRKLTFRVDDWSWMVFGADEEEAGHFILSKPCDEQTCREGALHLTRALAAGTSSLPLSSAFNAMRWQQCDDSARGWAEFEVNDPEQACENCRRESKLAGHHEKGLVANRILVATLQLRVRLVEPRTG